MIGELEVQPGQTATIPQACRSLLHKGPVRDGVFAGAVLIRVDDVPAQGAEVAAGQGLYWPIAALDITVENPSPDFPARILWSSDSDISRASPVPRSAVLLGGWYAPALAAVETDLYWASLIPEANVIPSGLWVSEKTREYFGREYLRPSDAVERPWKRTTLLVSNQSGHALTIKLYGGAQTGRAQRANMKLLGTMTMAVAASEILDVEIDGYLSLLVTYVLDSPARNLCITWMLHEGGTFAYTKAEIDAFLALYYTQVQIDAFLALYYTQVEIDAWRAGVTAAEMAFLHGVTADVQTQIDAKMPLAGGTFAGDVVFQGGAQVLDKVCAYLSASQSIPTGAWTKVELNAESFDTGGHFAGYKFTAAVAGYYQVSAAVRFANVADGKLVGIDIRKNGAAESTVFSDTGVAGAYPTPTVSRLVHLAATEFVELWAYHNQGGPRDADGGIPHTFMSILGPF